MAWQLTSGGGSASVQTDNRITMTADKQREQTVYITVVDLGMSGNQKLL